MSTTERLKKLEDWMEQYPKNVDFVLNAINTFIAEKHPELKEDWDSNILEWYKDHLKED